MFLLKLKMKLYSLLRRLGFISGVYYIGNTETLPPPMSAEEENDMISRLDTEPELRRTLVERNLRLVVYIAKKFENTGINIDDLVSIGTIGLIKASNTFKAEKNIKLATYASRCIENEILMYIRKTGGHRNEVSFDEPLNVDKDGNELLLSDILGSESDSVSADIEREEEKKIINEAVCALSKREREIIELRFGLGGRREMTQKETAQALGISQSYISRLEKRIIARLKKEISGKI
jgi:RNA polymerase sporulation-specific sigma factor